MKIQDTRTGRISPAVKKTKWHTKLMDAVLIIIVCVAWAYLFVEGALA